MSEQIVVAHCTGLLECLAFKTQKWICILMRHFGGPFICFKLDDESSIDVVILRQVGMINRIRGCFHRVSSDQIGRYTTNMYSSHESDIPFILLCQMNNFCLCRISKIQIVLKAIYNVLDAVGFRISFLEYNSEDSSFKPKLQKKNAEEHNYSFPAKLDYQIRRYESLSRTNNVITSDKLLKNANSDQRRIIFQCTIKKPSNKYKMVKSRNQVDCLVCNVYPIHGPNQHTNPDFPQNSNETSERHSDDNLNTNNGSIHTPMECEDSPCTTILRQPVCQDGASSIRLETSVSQETQSQMCISGRSFDETWQFQCIGVNSSNAADSESDSRLLSPTGGSHSRSWRQGLSGSSMSAQHQQYYQEHTETSLARPSRPQVVARESISTSDLRPVLGHIRSPEYADLTDRLQTFSRWPSDIVQTPAQVAEAGFYYTGLHDIVRCFVCDGGLKNWDPDDDPWIEHARWFPQCAFVLYEKGEEFVNLVRMAEESDEEEEYTVQRDDASGGAESSNTNTSSEISVPSVLDTEGAQLVLEMGYSKRDVAMAVNDIFKEGKDSFTGQDIVDIILEKETSKELVCSMLSADCSRSVENSSVSEQAICENIHLKALLQCTECKTKQRNILFLPCTHHVVCESCSRDLHICTYCYRKINEKVKTYMS